MTAIYSAAHHSRIAHCLANDFVWVGYDGSKIMGHRTMNWYNSPLGKARDKVEKWMADHPDREVSLILWGVGNHGGGPSRGDVYALEALIEETEAFTITSQLRRRMYFKDLKESGAHLPEHREDINPWAVGCYTSQVRIKQQHRKLENTFFAVEKMAATAAIYGVLPYPKAELDAALADLLMAEFHDILPGSSIQPVEDDLIALDGPRAGDFISSQSQDVFRAGTGSAKSCRGQDSCPGLQSTSFRN